MEMIPAKEVFTIATCRCQGVVLWGPLTRNKTFLLDTCPGCEETIVAREARIGELTDSGFGFTFGKTRYDPGRNQYN